MGFTLTKYFLFVIIVVLLPYLNFYIMEQRSQIIMDLLRLEGVPGVHTLDYPYHQVKAAASRIGGYCVRPDLDGTLVAYIGDGQGENPLELENRLKQADKDETRPFTIVGYKRSYVMEKLRRAGVNRFKVTETDQGVILTPSEFKIVPKGHKAMAMSEITEEFYKELLAEAEELISMYWSLLPYELRETKMIARPSIDGTEDKIGPPDEGIIMKRSWEVSDDII